jgi:two-component system response regulator MprA
MAKSVLVVDDEQDLRDMLRFALMADGYQVATAANGVEALESIRINQPQAVLLDLMMPRMTGYEVVEALRSEGRLEDVPVVILTARVIDDLDRDKLSGTRAILQKGSMDITSVVKYVNNCM